MKDDFEDSLAQCALQEPPPELRARILRRASSSVAPAIPWTERLAAWLWPHPRAWAAVAGVWLFIAALSFIGPRGPELYAVTPKGMTAPTINVEMYATYLREWEKLARLEMITESGIEPLDRRKL